MPLQPAGRFEWERILRRAVLPMRVKFLAFVLASYADADGSNVRPGVERLADITGFGTATVKRSLKALRDEYGLLGQVKRGGGRHGTGSAARYQLTIPEDLFDRVELLSPDDRRTENSDHPSDPSKDSSAPVDNSESGITQVIPQTIEDDADPPGIGITQVIHENGFQGSVVIPHPGLRDQNELMRDHPGDPLPQTNHQKMTTTSAPDVTVTSAREDRKCEHGFAAGRKSDGSPICVLCRRTTRSAS
jgi:hypothetical protein